MKAPDGYEVRVSYTGKLMTKVPAYNWRYTPETPEELEALWKYIREHPDEFDDEDVIAVGGTVRGKE